MRGSARLHRPSVEIWLLNLKNILQQTGVNVSAIMCAHTHTVSVNPKMRHNQRNQRLLLIYLQCEKNVGL